MSTVVVYGRLAINRMDNVASFLAHFGCGRLVDDWDGRTPLKEGDLALTNREPPFRAKGALVLSIAEALQRISAARRRA